MKKVAVVEDQDDMQLLYQIILKRIPQVKLISQPTDAEEAQEVFEKEQPDLAIIDISLPGKSGIDFAKELREKYPEMKIMIATGHDPDLYYKAAKKAGADDFIVKGDTAVILEKVRRLLGV
jgi:Response regulator containing a CheY-like receiver domain and an HTH DNA-binding domain